MKLDAEPVDTRLGRGWDDIARRDAERREWLDARARETAATGRKGCSNPGCKRSVRPDSPFTECIDCRVHVARERVGKR